MGVMGNNFSLLLVVIVHSEVGFSGRLKVKTPECGHMEIIEIESTYT